jgi:anti-sigma B factor antagonist
MAPQYAITRDGANNGTVRLELAGEFDLASADELRQALRQAIETDKTAQIYIDLARTTFIDSQTVAALVWGHDAACKAGSRLTVLHPHGLVHKVLEVTGVLEHLVDSSQIA